MGLDTNSVREINYSIRRLELDIKNLERTIETKRRNRFLDPAMELGLKQQIDEKRAEISGLLSEIRKLENEATRAQNMAE
jgi:hypothetical protein